MWAAIYNENCVKINFRGNAEQSLQLAAADTCYEERVLFRLLSGMHASINIHISLAYFPPRRGVRDAWESNVGRFMAQVRDPRDPCMVISLYGGMVVWWYVVLYQLVLYWYIFSKGPRSPIRCETFTLEQRKYSY